MRSNSSVLAEEGLDAHELSPVEIADDQLEQELEDSEYFSSPGYLMGQRLSEVEK